MCKDFRPVSILCVLTKVQEKMVHCQICEYLQCHNILNPLQSGFRKGYSTTTALVKVADDIRRALDETKVSVLALLDLSKAFDKVHHGLLIEKLRTIGFSDSVLCWCHSYLTERCQRVVAGENFTSDFAFIETGVPQGSVLGP